MARKHAVKGCIINRYIIKVYAGNANVATTVQIIPVSNFETKKRYLPVSYVGYLREYSASSTSVALCRDVDSRRSHIATEPST